MNNKKINYYLLYPAFLLLFLLQTSFLPQIFFDYTSPNLILIFIVILGLYTASVDFLYLSFFAGLFLDFYNGINFGIFSFGFLITAFFLRIFKEKLLKEDKSVNKIFVLSLSILFFNIFYIMILLFYRTYNLEIFENGFYKVVTEILFLIFLFVPIRHLIFKNN